MVALLSLATGLNAQVGGGSTTLEESVSRGEAEVLRGKADYNYLTAEAIKSLEQARSMNIDSERKALSNYYEARATNKAATTDQVKRFSTEQMAAIAKKEAPERLTPEQYNPTTGRLVWPTLLEAKVFIAHHDALNHMFKHRTTKDIGPETSFHATVRILTDEMQAMLHRHIDVLPPMEYTASKKFIAGIEQEAQLPPGPEEPRPSALVRP
jgi:hypothetical protein